MSKGIVCFEQKEHSDEHSAYLHFRLGGLTQEVKESILEIEGIHHLHHINEYEVRIEKGYLYSWNEIYDSIKNALPYKILIFE